MNLKGKEFVEHPSGLYVSMDGEVFMDIKCRTFPNGHFTYGSNCLGYKTVHYNNKNYRVHRLVAECWIDNPDNLPTVDHINRIKNDNRVENLRWATGTMQNYNRDITKFKNNTRSKLVLQYTPDGQLVKEWPSTKECQRNGFNQSCVWKCCHNKYNKSGNNVYKNHIWKFKNND